MKATDMHHSPRSKRLRATRRAEDLEHLESRVLLSAAMQIFGNGNAIAFNDSKPSVADFTDFRVMSTTVDATIGTATRVFVIANGGDATLNLPGASPVTISGPNAADFSVGLQPPGTVDSSNTTSFTINFAPHAAGKRTAKVTIHSDDPTHSAFTFTITGTGIKTTNNASTHLETAIIKAGARKAVGAVSGDDIIVNYTGFLLNGTVFDSSLFDSTANRGHFPFEVAPLGSAQVIDGWNQGLIGIKPGETRTLIIPAALAYGATGSGSIPPNATLIFNVTRITPPTLGIVGNGEPIVFNESLPSTLDGTFLGIISPSSTANHLTSTFQVMQASNTANGFIELSNLVKITGPQAADFSSSLITSDPVNGLLFTVDYHPKAAHTSSAVVHVRSTDGQNPDFTFAISAASTPFIDLTDAVGAVNFPTSGPITSGSPTKYTFPVTVTNHGNVPISATSAPIDIHILLQGSLGGFPIEILATTTTALRGLAPGQSRTVNVQAALPVQVAAGTYTVRADIDTTGAVAESITSNNSAFGAGTVTVIQGVYNLGGQLAASTFPTTLAHSAPLTGSLSVTLTNNSNVVLPATQSVTVQLVAIDTNTQAQTLIGATMSFSIASWTPGKFATFLLSRSLPAGLAAGTYQLGAIVTPTPDLAGQDVLTVTLDGSAAPIPLTVT